MKLLLGTLTLLALCAPAFADDTGVVGISVNDLQFASTKWDDQEHKNIETPIKMDANSTYVVKANGKGAAKLMRILPPVNSVLTHMYPRFASVYNANFRSLEITGAQGQPAVSLYCEGGTLTFPENPNNNNPPKFAAYPEGAHCTITVQASSEDDNVSYNFNPSKMICGR